MLDGACRISEIPKAAKAAGHNACAITDHGVMYGVVDFYKACKKEGIKPIIGCEVYVAPRSRIGREYGIDSDNAHLVLLCENDIGYKNLVYIVTKSFTDGFYSKPRIDMELLREHNEGLIALSACLGGRIPKLISAGNYEEAKAHAKEMLDIFGRDRFYLEIQDHGIEDQKHVNEVLFEMSRELGIDLVATNDVHYLKKSDSEAQAILMCIQTNSVISDGKPIGFETEEFYYKSTEEMQKLFPDHPEALYNTQKIADRCNFDFTFGKTYIPSYECPNGVTPYEYLKKLSVEGLENRINNGTIKLDSTPKDEYIKRMEYELSVIESMGYTQYFLVVWDFVNYSKSIGIPVGPGRGSGAGSLVAYLIGITDIDSIKFDLLFERFLNPERVSMPDFDIDFCYDRRDEAINYVREKYGHERTAQIITFGTLAARAAVRDVGRALGMSYAEVDEAAKLIPQEIGITLDEALKNKELREMYNDNPDIRKLIDTARALEGMPRHASTHAAGVVITELPLTEHLPLAVNNGVTVTQFDMDTVAELGLLKFDFLALRYLTIIDAAEKQIKERIPGFSVSNLPLDDKATFELISKGATDGVFQLESSGMRSMLTQLKPESLDDVIAAIALYRPGPMDSIPKYIAARHSGKTAEYKIPALKPILDVTYGCIVYQEQVMRIFRDVAGYSLGHADIVRRAISKKKTEVLLSEKQSFIEGAAERGVNEKDAIELFDDIESFANYAFNKSHAAAYAVISYRTAYLKAHYLTEYNCALLASVQNSPAKISEYITECKRNGIKVLPPDVNFSMTDFHVEDNNIRFGLAALKNVGRAFIDQVISERFKCGKFTDVENFVDRMKPLGMNKRQMEALIKSGSLDSLGAKRSQLLDVYEKLLEKDSSSSLEGQLDMFSMLEDAGSVVPKIEFRDIPEFTARQLLLLEKEASGMYLSGHILDDYDKCATAHKPDSIMDIITSFSENSDSGRYKDGDKVCVCGVVTKRSNKVTRKGDHMAFITVEDRSGEIEVIVFAKNLANIGHMLTTETAVCIKGSITQKDDENAKLILNDVEPLVSNDEFVVKQPEVKKTTKESKEPMLYLKVPSVESTEYTRCCAFIEIFRGSIPVLIYASDTGKRYKAPGFGVALDEFTMNELKEILGSDSVILK